MKQWYVGVDGGGTKTAVAISTADSVPIQTMTYPTCSYQSIGIPESVALITKVVREALSGGGVSPQDCAGCCVGMPCYGENPANDREIVRLLTDALTPVPVYVVNDGELGWIPRLWGGNPYCFRHRFYRIWTRV